MMASIPSTIENIKALQQKANVLLSNISKKMNEEHELSNADSLQKLELDVHQMAQELADVIVGIKFQEHLDKEETKTEQTELVKSQPTKIKKHCTVLICFFHCQNKTYIAICGCFFQYWEHRG